MENRLLEACEKLQPLVMDPTASCGVEYCEIQHLCLYQLQD